MLRSLITLPALCVALMTPLAAETVTGLLMDQKCWRMADDKSHAGASKNTRRCMLMHDCVESGYGVVTAEGDFYIFDHDGSDKAHSILVKSACEDSVEIEVTGEIDGNTLKVKSITAL